MPADLEAQLRASLPGRSTEVQDYARLMVAADQLRLAVDLLTRARGAIAVALDRDRPAVAHADAADLEARKAVLDIERALKNHPAGRAPK